MTKSTWLGAAVMLVVVAVWAQPAEAGRRSKVSFNFGFGYSEYNSGYSYSDVGFRVSSGRGHYGGHRPYYGRPYYGGYDDYGYRPSYRYERVYIAPPSVYYCPPPRTYYHDRGSRYHGGGGHYYRSRGGYCR